MCIECTNLFPSFSLQVIGISPAINYALFKLTGELRMAIDGYHKVHSSSCEKPPVGLYMCRLAYPRPINCSFTRPLSVRLLQRGNRSKKKRPSFSINPITPAVEAELLAKINYAAGQFLDRRTSSNIFWELHRPERDKNLCEYNPLVASLSEVGKHNNQTPNNPDGGGATEEYVVNYISNNGSKVLPNSRLHAISFAALKDIVIHPSTLEDRDTPTNKAVFWKTKTANQIVGKMEWSQSLMAYILLGKESFSSSDSYAYINAAGSADECHNNMASTVQNSHVPSAVQPVVASANTQSTPSVVNNTLTSLAELQNSLREEKASGRLQYKGRKLTLANDVVVYYTYAQLFDMQPPVAEDLLFIEYACVTGVNNVRAPSKKQLHAGRPRGKEWAMHGKAAGQILMTVLQKLKTPIFFGIPPFPGDCPQEDAQNMVASSLIRDAWEIDMLQWCRVVVPLFTSWRTNFPSSVPSNRHGLAHLLTTWNCSSTTCLNKLRGVTLQNLIKHTARLIKCNAWTEF